MTVASVEKNVPRGIPTWRKIFDQGSVSQYIIDQDYDGAGTEEDPYQVSWVEEDPCDPMLLSAVKKWLIMALVGIETLAVALVSSAYSVAL